MIKKVAFYSKINKPDIKEIIAYLNQHFEEVFIFQSDSSSSKMPSEAFEVEPDLLISYLSPWIIPDAILNKTRLFNINFHPGSPDYPGIGCFNFALYDMAKEYGITAHLMEKVVDSGKIVRVKKFPVLPSDTVHSLSLKSYSYMFNLFIELVDYIKQNNNLPPCSEVWKRKAYTRKELENLCKIDINMSTEEIDKRIRATYYPGMPSAYVEIQNHKFEYNPER